jgi:hypothetical protein
MLTSGVPQGSFLGPLLFVILLNDLPCGLHQAAKPVICADDTSVLLTARNDKGLKIKFNGSLDYMIGWFSASGLTWNMDKTNIMKFLISSFHHVLYVVCNLLGCSPAYGV